MLFNLAGNAIKFTESGGVSIIVEPGTQPDDDCHRGARHRHRHLAPRTRRGFSLEFEQADGGSTRKFGGTGLGLTISNRIVESMGGTIAVESAPGRGRHLPRQRSAAALPAMPTSRRLPVPDLAGHDVLIVAPAAIEASLIARRLQRWGARTTIVPDDKVAAALLPERPWSAVLVDHALGTAQSEALARLAATVPRRIVLVTPAMRHRTRGAQGSGLHRLPDQAGARRLARRALFRGRRLRAGSGRTPRRRPSEAPAGGGLSILVAEDNEINALLARALLDQARPPSDDGRRRRGGASNHSLPPVRPARPYDRVLMDLHMPGMDGIEATRRIRAIEAEQARRARRSSR